MTDRLKKALKEERLHPRGAAGPNSITNMRKNYSDKALDEMLKREEDRGPEDHDGDNDPLGFGYSGPE